MRDDLKASSELPSQVPQVNYTAKPCSSLTWEYLTGLFQRISIRMSVLEELSLKFTAIQSLSCSLAIMQQRQFSQFRQFAGQVQLGIISITVEGNILFDDVAQRELMKGK